MKSKLILIALFSVSLVFVGPKIYGNKTLNSLASGDVKGKFKDSRDGNVYKIVKIGEQVWMAENLRYMPLASDPGLASGVEPYYHVLGYEGTEIKAAKASSTYKTYGTLYNWTAAQTACPTGWHLPTDDEWTQLTDFVGGEDNAAALLKSKEGWEEGGNGTDKYGFAALPGSCLAFGKFHTENVGHWWTASEYEHWEDDAYSRDIWHNKNSVGRYDIHKDFSFSVRCVKD